MISTSTTRAALAACLLLGCETGGDDSNSDTEDGSTSSTMTMTASSTMSSSASTTASTSSGPTTMPGSESTTGDPPDDTTTSTTDPTSGSTDSTGETGGLEVGELAVFLGDDFNGVLVYTIADGVATELDDSPYAEDEWITAMTLLGDQLFAAEREQFSESIFSFDVDLKTGELTPTAETTGNFQMDSAASHPTMPVIYFGDSIADELGAYAVADDGALTPIGTNIDGMRRVSVNPSGTYAYGSISNAIHAFAVQGDGSLVEVAGPIGNYSGPGALVVDEAEACGYFNTFAGLGSATIAADGTPTLLAPTSTSPRTSSGASVPSRATPVSSSRRGRGSAPSRSMGVTPASSAPRSSFPARRVSSRRCARSTAATSSPPPPTTTPISTSSPSSPTARSPTSKAHPFFIQNGTEDVELIVL